MISMETLKCSEGQQYVHNIEYTIVYNTIYIIRQLLYNYQLLANDSESILEMILYVPQNDFILHSSKHNSCTYML